MSYETPEKIMDRVFNDAVEAEMLDVDAPARKATEMEKLLIESNEAMQSGDFERLEVLSQQVKALEDHDIDLVDPAEKHALADLEQAIEAGDLEAARDIVMTGLDLNQVNGDGGLTPLEAAIAVQNYAPEMVEMLLEKGADPNFQAVSGMAPLQLLVGYMHSNPTVEQRTETARLLVKYGADTELRNARGWTPLANAVKSGTLEEMQALLMVGADPNMLFDDMAMPEHMRNTRLIACAIEDPEKVDMLIDFGADPLANCEGGQTAAEILDIALTDAVSQKVSFVKKLVGGTKAKRAKIAALERSRALVLEACDI